MKTSIAQVAWEVMKEEEMELIWYGHPDIIHVIYGRWQLKNNNPKSNAHPINAIATVLAQLSKSCLFQHWGYINHLGRDYPVFKIKT